MYYFNMIMHVWKFHFKNAGNILINGLLYAFLMWQSLTPIICHTNNITIY